MMHRQFFKTVSQNPEYVKTHCNDMENPPNFAIHNWMIKQQIGMVIVCRKTLPLNTTFQDLFNDIFYVVVIKIFVTDVYHV